MSLRRALLFMPGDSEHKIQKAATLDVDCIIMDLEDGVAASQKEAARATVRLALLTKDFGHRERVVRLNPVGSGLEEADLAETVAGRPDAYVVPKVEWPQQLVWLDERLGAHENEQGWPFGAIRLLAIVETALGIMNLKEIAQATSRLEALMFGAEDLVGNIGGRRTQPGWEVFYARSAVSIAAAAYDLQAIDMIFVDLNDLDGLKAECQQAVDMGFQGKMAIHPRQVPVIQAAFSPSTEQIDQALSLMAAYRAHEAMGAGAFTLEGKMVDAPMLRIAQRVLARARAAGLIGETD